MSTADMKLLVNLVHEHSIPMKLAYERAHIKKVQLY